MTQTELNDLMIAKLREVKQRTYNNEVNGYGERPTEAIDRVMFAMAEVFPRLSKRFFDEVINFDPDYEEGSA